MLHRVDPHYPVLSARQSSSNLARDVKSASRNGARSPLAERRVREPVNIPLPESPEVSSRIMQVPSSVSQEQFLPLPTRSNEPVNVVTEQALVVPSQPALRKIDTPSPPSSRSVSFKLPGQLPDVSNLLDASVGFGREIIGDETFDLDIASLRPKAARAPLPAAAALPSGSIPKRTFPSSSSGNSLASVGEEKHILDQSTLLPTSPIKIQDLLKDMITNESFFEEPSMFLPLPPASVRKTPRRPVHAADVTMDLQTLMSKVKRPKRASGTEESFVDLLHGEPSMMDMYVTIYFLLSRLC